MALQSDSADFLELFRKSSKELFSEKFYEAMNSDSFNSSKFYHRCNEISVSNHKDKVITICKKFLRFLEKSTAWNIENSRYDVSILLNYWIYDKLTDIYGDKNDKEISFGFAALQYAWEYHNYNPKNQLYHQKYKPDLNMVNHDDWKKRKELYDYCINYDLIVPLCRSYDQTCMEYYEYIEKKGPLYEEYEKICIPGESKCPHFYEKCRDYNPKSFLSELPCHSKIVANKSAAAKAGTQHHPSGPEQGFGPQTFSMVSTSETSEIGTKVGHSVLGVAPVLLTATALYRYTPVGSWIRKLGGYNSNGVSDMDEFSSYTQESKMCIKIIKMFRLII
ncbi:PIR Superfamily Protein [Plasmodium ovale wallikeri]|uniref:PIR Superfamily Protein n=1 Tax=Plasmodium ovale wallikeri TaxID=864142 RepID=A0A1A9AII0_PLAOA|nr:PIR Superfamily Protein [Plasmodium ovale wallikeri]